MAFVKAAILALVVASTSRCRGPMADPCLSSGPAVVVVVRDRSLWLCDQGHARARYRVALGRGGAGKQVERDGKTPLGTYALGVPHPSVRFGTFIPVAYPTPDQQRQGFTGRDVGIHGPDRRLRWAGSMNSCFDWTAGCIALGTDAEVQQVAAFVRERKPSIFIRWGDVREPDHQGREGTVRTDPRRRRCSFWALVERVLRCRTPRRRGVHGRPPAAPQEALRGAPARPTRPPPHRVRVLRETGAGGCHRSEERRVGK